MEYLVLLFYKYTKIEDPEAEKAKQEKLCEKLNLTCRMIIAHEGINGNLEGSPENIEQYIKIMSEDSRFENTHWKRSEGFGNAFPGVKIKVRPEILSINLGEEDFDPNEISGEYITAEQLHALYERGEEFYVVDMRNDFEHKVGYFDDSIRMPFKALRELPEKLDILEEYRDKMIITVCTGGVKCEKASGYLVKKGFTNVYQLHGGIHDYIEKFPNQHFKGKLYVYDGRIVMGFELNSDKHEVVAHCDKCGAQNDNYVDCAYLHCKGHRHFIACENCMEEDGLAFCSKECKELAYQNEKVFIRSD